MEEKEIILEVEGSQEQPINLILENNGEKTIDLKQENQGGTSDYGALLNKPKINNIELKGNKTLEELGIQPKGNYLTFIPEEYVTDEELDNKGYLTEHQNLDHLATKEDLNTKAEVNHSHSEYVTDEELASKGYLTEHQDISNLATKKELNDGLNGKANSNHTHSEYLTSIPSEYVTETELNNKGYLTQEDIKDIDVDINSISEETIKEIVNIQIVNANEVSY